MLVLMVICSGCWLMNSLIMVGYFWSWRGSVVVDKVWYLVVVFC